MNDISDDVYKVIFGNGKNGSRRLKLCKDESHRLDTLSVSNCSSRNGNSWFVALIASLYIMAKTFAKIAKTFVALLATIVAKGRRLVVILHLEAKYAKMDCKNEIYAKNWVRSTWIAKVNPRKSQRPTFQKSKSMLKESTAWGQSQSGDDVSGWRN